MTNFLFNLQDTMGFKWDGIIISVLLMRKLAVCLLTSVKLAIRATGRTNFLASYSRMLFIVFFLVKYRCFM